MYYTNKPNRLKGFDYSSGQYYFVTSVVKNRVRCFGAISQGEMILNEYGKITLEQLRWLPQQYSYVRLLEHVVMPDHIHAVLEIDPLTTNHQGKIKSLSELMGAFKSRSSKLIRLEGLKDFQWQTSFHDRIIHSEVELERVEKYILENPIAYVT